MKPLTTVGIVMARTDYHEADRILTILTPDQGKLHLMAKGVRRIKSKLAGGIELFSVSEITFIRGRKDMGTLLSARLKVHYGAIVSDLNRTMMAYEVLKMLNRATEDEPDGGYFEILQTALAGLDRTSLDLQLIQLWFQAQLIKLGGHQPNLLTDKAGKRLVAETSYRFDFESMCFERAPHGTFQAPHIKVLRLLFGIEQPEKLQAIEALGQYLGVVAPLLQTMLKTYIRL